MNHHPEYDRLAPGLLDETFDGFFPCDNDEGLRDILRRKGVSRVVEIGSYCGASARMIGTVLKQRAGTLWCVDPWDAQFSQFHTPVNWEEIYQRFLSNMIHAGLRDIVRPIRMKSVDAAKEFADGSLDLVYIDGFHSKDAVRDDIVAWWPKIRDWGFLCGDDIGWEGIKDGIAEACEIVGAMFDESVSCPHFWKLEPKATPCR